MPNVYFLNAQDAVISVQLNSGQAQKLIGFADPDPKQSPYCSFSLAASVDKNVFGTGGDNLVIIESLATSKSQGWKITTSANPLNKILPDKDIQILILQNQLIARQGSVTDGFKVTPAP